jgi:hypothetical protein
MSRLESGDTVWFRPEEEDSAISAVVRVTDNFLMQLRVEVLKIYVVIFIFSIYIMNLYNNFSFI